MHGTADAPSAAPAATAAAGPPCGPDPAAPAEVRGSAAALPGVPPVDPAVLLELQRALGVSHVAAQALARRGLVDSAAAGAWLEARSEGAAELPNIDAAAGLLRRHAEAGGRILVHGDYDVDGICGTAILLDLLELLGASAAWHLPKRGIDGYGLTDTSLARITRLAPTLVVTVDCGITAVEPVAALKARGIDVLVTDHHQARADGVLPDCTVLHPAVDGDQLIEPQSAPAGAGVAAALALRVAADVGRSVPALRDGIGELAALATVADCVDLTGANRSLVREGLAALCRTRRPGLRALLQRAKVDVTALDGTAVAFRLAPRLNSAGRMARADLALALVRAADQGEAERLVDELERCNLQRREVELRVRREAEAQVRDLGPRDGYVLSGPDWPAGVVGIVASRIAEQTGRPAVVVGVDGERATGSARSAAGLDVAALLRACGDHLDRSGGHTAAAGCELAASELAGFRDAFDRAATVALETAEPERPDAVDAVAELRDLTLDLAEELSRFEPTGEGNPAVRLLLPAVRVAEESPMGSGNSHRRAVLSSGGVRCNAVAFSSPALPTGVPVDVVARLERSRWGGTVEARVVVESVHARERQPERAALGRDAGALAALVGGYETELPTPRPVPKPTLDRRGASVGAALRTARARGFEVIAYAAAPERRGPQLRALGWDGAVAGPTTLAAATGALGAHGLVVCVDPPLDPRAVEAIDASGVDTWWSWTEAELTYAVHVLEQEFALRPLMVAAFRGLRDAAGPLGLLQLLALLPDGASAAGLGRAIRALEELGHVRVADGLHSVTLVDDPPAGGTAPTQERATAILEGARRWSLSPASA